MPSKKKTKKGPKKAAKADKKEGGDNKEARSALFVMRLRQHLLRLRIQVMALLVWDQLRQPQRRNSPVCGRMPRSWS
jgi:hypothetical protein